MRRFGLVLTAIAFAAVVAAASGSTARSTSYSVDNPIKINVMGEWAHPDDDTSIIGPCGVWHQQFGIRCGIIMITRGEGGGNAVGTEIGPALGLRRENEDRSAHYRSGTVDIFNVDTVDFFYNQSAPLTQFFWGHDETLRRVTRIIRMTQPDVYIGFTPTLAAGHGNHQQAGRFIWEGMLAAANPAMFPDQLTGRARARPVAGQEDLLRRQHRRHRRDDHGRRLHDRLHPDARCEPRHRRRRVDGLRLAVPLAGGQRPGQDAARQDLGAGRVRGRVRLPDAEPRDEHAAAAPGLLALRPDLGNRAVPAEHEPGRHGEPARRQGQRDPLRRDRAGSRRAAARDARVPHVRPLLQRRRAVVPGDAAPEGRRRSDSGRHGGADRADGLDGRRREADRAGRERRRDDGRRSPSRRARRRRRTNFKISALVHERRGHRLHRQRRARRAGRRGPLPALGQLGGVRQLAPDRRAAGAPARPLGGDPDDRRRRDVHAARSTSTTGRPRRRAARSR